MLLLASKPAGQRAFCHRKIPTIEGRLLSWSIKAYWTTGPENYGPLRPESTPGYQDATTAGMRYSIITKPKSCPFVRHTAKGICRHPVVVKGSTELPRGFQGTVFTLTIRSESFGSVISSQTFFWLVGGEWDNRVMLKFSSLTFGFQPSWGLHACGQHPPPHGVSVSAENSETCIRLLCTSL